MHPRLGRVPRPPPRLPRHERYQPLGTPGDHMLLSKCYAGWYTFLLLQRAEKDLFRRVEDQLRHEIADAGTRPGTTGRWALWEEEEVLPSLRPNMQRKLSLLKQQRMQSDEESSLALINDQSTEDFIIGQIVPSWKSSGQVQLQNRVVQRSPEGERAGAPPSPAKKRLAYAPAAATIATGGAASPPAARHELGPPQRPPHPPS